MAYLIAAPVATGEVAATTEDDTPTIEQETQQIRRDAAALDEDPEAQRREQADAGIRRTPTVESDKWILDLYASVRIHAINSFNLETGERSAEVGDGQSRFGARGDWDLSSDWEFIGRAEYGFDVVDQFSTRGSTDGDGGLQRRLLYAGFDSKILTLTYGKDWSAYYRIAGMTDRFAIFGGAASGVYNAGTVGESTGTGRADDILKARIYIDTGWDALGAFKPGNLNLQYQQSQPIPRVAGQSYDYGFGASAWIETESEYGIGLAYNLSKVSDPSNAAIQQAGIDGDAVAVAVSGRSFGDRWFVSMLLSRLENIETTNLDRYINASGIEVYGQWEFKRDWWLIGGINALEPDDDDPDAGEYRVRHAIIGARYSFDSFERMLYVEYRLDEGRAFDGSKLQDEVTIGIRWDFGS